MTTSIFLADDHAIVRDGLRLLLETESDFSVVGEAGSGLQTINALQKQCADVAIIDISMPELNGIDTTRSISLLCPNTRVIILSMHSSPDYIARALQAGARGYLLKSSVGAEVIDAIRTVVAGHRYLSLKVSDLMVDDYLARLETSEPLSPLAELSPRELSILQLVAEGRASIEIAGLLGISSSTVDTYRSRVMQKLGLRNLSELVRFAIKQGLLDLE
jgi:DNA-binding NarL/FixJ family response regulator